MSPITTCGPGEADESYELVAIEAMLAGTMALMTGFAQTGLACPNRPVMAAKLVANLGQFAAHPGLSSAMHRVMQRLAAHWEREQGRLCGAGFADAAGTHAAPARLQ